MEVSTIDSIFGIILLELTTAKSAFFTLSRLVLFLVTYVDVSSLLCVDSSDDNKKELSREARPDGYVVLFLVSRGRGTHF